MELGVAITLMVGLSFIGLLGVKVARSYFATESHRISENIAAKENATITDLNLKLTRAYNVAAQSKHKLMKIRNTYDLDYDDIDEDEIENDADGEFKLSSLATAIYPKLPPSISNLIDKEEFQNAIIKTVDKKPELITHFIDKFITKSDSSTDSNTEIKLKESYL